jgi:hypothetical protein
MVEEGRHPAGAQPPPDVTCDMLKNFHRRLSYEVKTHTAYVDQWGDQPVCPGAKQVVLQMSNDWPLVIEAIGGAFWFVVSLS